MEKYEPFDAENQDHRPISPELREEAIKRILKNNPMMEEHTKIRMMDQMRRNGRWGTCVDCPDDQGRTFAGNMMGDGRSNKIFPENCPNTDRYDHWLGIDALDVE